MVIQISDPSFLWAIGITIVFSLAILKGRRLWLKGNITKTEVEIRASDDA